MTKPYKEYKVNELKELLKERGLSASGTKSELINRLEEADASAQAEPASAGADASEAAAESAAEEPNEDPVSVPASKEGGVEAAKEEQKVEPTSDEAVSESKQEEAAPAAPEPSDEELLAKFKADVTTRIERTKRFGGDASELEARLRRIEKFGISAVRDAAAKASAPAVVRQRGNSRRKNKNRKRNGPKPATA